MRFIWKVFFKDVNWYWEIVAGAAIFLLLRFAVQNLAWMRTTIPGALLAPALMSVAALLYAFRHFARLGYAFLELAVGMTIIFISMMKAPRVVDPLTDNLMMVQIAGGMYLMIRAFDNALQTPLFNRLGPAFHDAWEIIRGRPPKHPW